MSQKLVEELIAEGIYCDTDVSHLTGNFVKVAERRACAPSVAKGETELESFSDSWIFLQVTVLFSAKRITLKYFKLGLLY